MGKKGLHISDQRMSRSRDYRIDKAGLGASKNTRALEQRLTFTNFYPQLTRFLHVVFSARVYINWNAKEITQLCIRHIGSQT